MHTSIMFKVVKLLKASPQKDLRRIVSPFSDNKNNPFFLRLNNFLIFEYNFNEYSESQKGLETLFKFYNPIVNDDIFSLLFNMREKLKISISRMKVYPWNDETEILSESFLNDTKISKSKLTDYGLRITSLKFNFDGGSTDLVLDSSGILTAEEREIEKHEEEMKKILNIIFEE